MEVESELLPVKSPEFKVAVKTLGRARVDIAANGLWGSFQKAIFGFCTPTVRAMGGV